MPNYEIQLRSHINAVKAAYNDYKKALIKYVDHTFITDDGSFAYYDGGLKEKVDELFTVYVRQATLLEEFKNEHKEKENV